MTSEKVHSFRDARDAHVPMSYCKSAFRLANERRNSLGMVHLSIILRVPPAHFAGKIEGQLSVLVVGGHSLVHVQG